MLLNLREYHRPEPTGGDRQAALQRALALLARSEIHTTVLAGGDALVGSAGRDVEAVVDLQALGLDGIEAEPGAGERGGGRGGERGGVRIGALATRAALAESDLACERWSGLLARAAGAWGGSVQRNRATVGGAVALAAGNDALVAALLACDARVALFRADGASEMPLADFVARRGEILAQPTLITELLVPEPAENSGGGLAIVGRTPADAPIVLAAAVVELAGGVCQAARLALGGVAATPCRIAEAEALLVGQAPSDATIQGAAERAGSLVDPAGDFRGSAAYRRAMAVTLAARALREAWVQAQ